MDGEARTDDPAYGLVPARKSKFSCSGEYYSLDRCPLMGTSQYWEPCRQIEGYDLKASILAFHRQSPLSIDSAIRWVRAFFVNLSSQPNLKALLKPADLLGFCQYRIWLSKNRNSACPQTRLQRENDSPTKKEPRDS
jgi:hypothetical protein